ncbi:hypothetical protein [Roseateles sp.]|uniref:hypothetical protein n=1 Tax=Roseateles sp. TaxID=1971397 RepID=UPI002DFF55E3|nr:hypothetical protein [Roseateles sp.]
MKRWLRTHPWRAATLALLAVAVSVLVATGRTPLYTPAYTPKTTSTITAERRTHCLGRYLVDLPADFTQFSGGWGAVV